MNALKGENRTKEDNGRIENREREKKQEEIEDVKRRKRNELQNLKVRGKLRDG